MSSLLEQAIIDATALKEAALKNAEAMVLEKYSADVKDAIKNLLEQEEGFETPSLTTEPQPTSGINGGNIADQLEQAYTDGSKLCQCPEDDDVLELDLTNIAGMADQAGINLDTMSNDDLRQSQVAASLEEELEINKNELLDLYEKLTVDARTVPYGNIEYPANTLEVEFQKDLAAAKQAQLEVEEENKDLKKENKQIKNEYSKLQKITEALANKVETYEATVTQLKEKFDKVNLTNAKLLYTNRVLNSDSLNERQKDKIVEALSNAKTTDEAKTIYETLQSTVVGNNKISTPKSLSEAINRSSSRIFETKQNNANTTEMDRMQRLAGIK